jgi:hypothetical protein
VKRYRSIGTHCPMIAAMGNLGRSWFTGRIASTAKRPQYTLLSGASQPTVRANLFVGGKQTESSITVAYFAGF